MVKKVLTAESIEMARTAESSGGISVETLLADLLPQAEGAHEVHVKRA